MPVFNVPCLLLLIDSYLYFNLYNFYLKLDEVVINACREHMRECCGDALDNMKGANYEVNTFSILVKIVLISLLNNSF